MKVVVVLNRKYPLPVLLNAAGHVLFGLPGLTAGDLKLRDFHDADRQHVSHLTDFPLIVLTARNGNHLREFHAAASADGLAANAFFPCMTAGSPAEQEREIASASHDALDFVAVAAFGPADALDPLTRRFSLLRESDVCGRSAETG